jgi:hypothetical protein
MKNKEAKKCAFQLNLNMSFTFLEKFKEIILDRKSNAELL